MIHGVEIDSFRKTLCHLGISHSKDDPPFATFAVTEVLNNQTERFLD